MNDNSVMVVKIWISSKKPLEIDVRYTKHELREFHIITS